MGSPGMVLAVAYFYQAGIETRFDKINSSAIICIEFRRTDTATEASLNLRIRGEHLRSVKQGVVSGSFLVPTRGPRNLLFQIWI